jgi:hypothetical protein
MNKLTDNLDKRSLIVKTMHGEYNYFIALHHCDDQDQNDLEENTYYICYIIQYLIILIGSRLV